MSKAISFSPSVNIARDQDREFYYIPTDNARRVYQQIIENYSNSAAHSFCIIGPYGTGKSAFILALERHLKANAKYFDPLNGTFQDIEEFEFLNIVGESDSFINLLVVLLLLIVSMFLICSLAGTSVSFISFATLLQLFKKYVMIFVRSFSKAVLS